MLFSLFTNQESVNIFVTLLDALKVKHTKLFSNKYFNEHPHRNSLYGLSKMLSDYQIENQGLRIKDKEKVLPELEAPFIAHTGSDFITVMGVRNEKVDYIWKDKIISLPTNEFISTWSGIVLLTEANENSIEPDYEAHHTNETISFIKRILLIFAIILFSGIIVFQSQIYANWRLIVSLFIHISGLYISYLLLLKQMHIANRYADKICSLLIDKSDCNNILETDAAKIMGFSWSEIGVGYFISNILIILFFPSLYTYMVWINICALPYTIWSVWYQKFKANQWCPLCLIVQCILWVLFIANLLFGFIVFPVITIPEILLTGCLYMIPVFLLNQMIPFYEGYKKKEAVTQQINSLKANEEIFKSLLVKTTKYDTNNLDSAIMIGNPHSKNTITVVTNPHCNPCAKVHAKLEKLLTDTNDGYCIRYILTSFGKEFEESSTLFIDMYHKLDPDAYRMFLNEWYAYGKNNRHDFYKKYGFENNGTEVTVEAGKHKEWIRKANITATPVILLNDHELPNEYSIEDLKYFSGMNI